MTDISCSNARSWGDDISEVVTRLSRDAVRSSGSFSMTCILLGILIMVVRVVHMSERSVMAIPIAAESVCAEPASVGLHSECGLRVIAEKQTYVK